MGLKTKKNKKVKYFSVLALVLALGIALYFFTGDSDSDSMGFTDMILNAENDMVNLDQSDPKVLALLQDYKPRVYIDKASYFPQDFYADYVPNTHLYKTGRMDTLVSESVTKEDLIKHIYDSEYYIDYQIEGQDLLNRFGADYRTSVYGRAYKSKLKTPTETLDLVFLKYTLVFPYSGLPAETAWWKLAASNVVGDPMAWHELDIHGAIHVVLEASTMQPVGIILGQHNHHKVHLVGDKLDWPKDNHVPIAYSKYSNEPYLASSDGMDRIERTVGNPMEMEFLLGISDDEPLTAGYDFIPGTSETSVEIGLDLVQLSPEDPLYRATMGLGDRKKILGLFRTFYLDGPPGVDFYTLPDMLDLAELMAFWYIDVEDEAYLNVYNAADLSFMNFDISDIQAYQRPKLLEKIKSLLNRH